LFSAIDLTLDGGLGGVISKNDTILQDTLIWGIGAVKHANGRDWWIVMLKDDSDIIFKILFTPQGISSILTQQLNFQPNPWGIATQLVFSQNGEKFAYSNNYMINGNWKQEVRLLNFDRCSGSFSNETIVDVSDSLTGFGISFSSSSKYLYVTSVLNV